MDVLFQVRRGNGVYEILDGEGNILDATPIPEPETPAAYVEAVTYLTSHVITVQSQFLG